MIQADLLCSCSKADGFLTCAELPQGHRRSHPERVYQLGGSQDIVRAPAFPNYKIIEIRRLCRRNASLYS
jgi:hypothetical protein